MGKKTTICRIIILCTMALFVLTGCTKSAERREIIIGVAWPFASNNSQFNEGIDLAVEEINRGGGINGRQLRLVKEDDGAELVKGMAIAESFAQNKEIQAVIGHRNSFISIPVSAVYDRAGLVMLSPASTAPDLTRNGYRHIFRNLPGDDEIARQMAIYLAKQGHRRLAIYYADDSYGIELANSFEDQARSQGIVIIDRFNFYNGPEDLRRLDKRWQAHGIDGIFIAHSLSEGSQFICDAGQAGINGPFFAGNALDSPSLPATAGQGAEGVIIGSVFNPEADRVEVKKFVTNFRQEYKEMPGAYAALGYDAVKILAAAIEQSDVDKPSTVARELINLGRWPGVVGIHEFDAKGDDVGDLVALKKIQNGRFVIIEK